MRSDIEQAIANLSSVDPRPVVKIISLMIDKARDHMETCDADEFATLQGEIKGYRKLKSILEKK